MWKLLFKYNRSGDHISDSAIYCFSNISMKWIFAAVCIHILNLPSCQTKQVLINCMHLFNWKKHRCLYPQREIWTLPGCLVSYAKQVTHTYPTVLKMVLLARIHGKKHRFLSQTQFPINYKKGQVFLSLWPAFKTTYICWASQDYTQFPWWINCSESLNC